MYGLLLAPDPGDSLDSKLALLAYNDLEAYKHLVKPSGEALDKNRDSWFRELDAGASISTARPPLICLFVKGLLRFQHHLNTDSVVKIEGH